MLRHQRHKAILQYLEENESLRLEQLSTMLDISESTLRRDIIMLSDAKKVNKVRGGVARVKDLSRTESRLVTSPFSDERMKNEDCKAAIGKKAVELLTGQESIIINGGTTTYHFAQQLPDTGFTILTNSLPVVDIVSRQLGNRCFVMGGEVFHHHMLILGHLHGETPNFYGDMFFTGCQGISPWGIMEGDPLLVHSEEQFIEKCDKLVVLADSSKFTTRRSMIMCPLGRVDIVVTDSKITEESKKMLKDAGVELIIADL